MEKKIIELNSKYKVVITFNNDINRLYRLVDNEDKTICESFNRDTFLLKANKYTKINNKTECLIASI